MYKLALISMIALFFISPVNAGKFGKAGKAVVRATKDQPVAGRNMSEAILKKWNFYLDHMKEDSVSAWVLLENEADGAAWVASFSLANPISEDEDFSSYNELYCELAAVWFNESIKDEEKSIEEDGFECLEIN